MPLVGGRVGIVREAAGRDYGVHPLVSGGVLVDGALSPLANYCRAVGECLYSG